MEKHENRIRFRVGIGFIFLLGGLLICQPRLDAQDNMAVRGSEMIQPGWQHIRVSGKSGWLALYCNRNKSAHASLKRCSVYVGPRFGEDSEHPDARNVTVNPSKDFIFAVRGLPQLRPGRVSTYWYKDVDWRPINDLFIVGKQKYRLIRKQVPESETDPGGDRIDLRLEGHDQEIDACVRKFSADPVWVGDLDGDGKPDIYVEEQHNGGNGRNLLFLSTLAKKGELVGAAVEYDYENEIQG